MVYNFESIHLRRMTKVFKSVARSQEPSARSHQPEDYLTTTLASPALELGELGELGEVPSQNKTFPVLATTFKPSRSGRKVRAQSNRPLEKPWKHVVSSLRFVDL